MHWLWHSVTGFDPRSVPVRDVSWTMWQPVSFVLEVPCGQPPPRSVTGLLYCTWPVALCCSPRHSEPDCQETGAGAAVRTMCLQRGRICTCAGRPGALQGTGSLLYLTIVFVRGRLTGKRREATDVGKRKLYKIMTFFLYCSLHFGGISTENCCS